MTIAPHELKAAEESVGWEVIPHDALAALEKWRDATLSDMRLTLERCVARFEGNGARGVAIADEIDMLRIAIAIREMREALLHRGPAK